MTNLLLYQRIAQQLAEDIRRGVYQPGERVPSVRKMSSQLNVSHATVLQAYANLEDQGLIRARPQSGYYVHQTPALTAPTVAARAFATLDHTTGGGRILIVWVADSGDSFNVNAHTDGVYVQVYNMNDGAAEGNATLIRGFGTGSNYGLLADIDISADLMADGRFGGRGNHSGIAAGDQVVDDVAHGMILFQCWKGIIPRLAVRL